jgi:hypothetical protein
MSKKSKREAAARARLGRAAMQRLRQSPSARANNSLSTTSSTSNGPNLPVEDMLDLDADSDWDCGYDGGLNHDMSEDETEAWTDKDASDAEGLCELEGEELEANLRLGMLMTALDEGNVFEALMAKKTDMPNVVYLCAKSPS